MNIGIDLDDTINTLAPILLKYAIKYNKVKNINHEIKPHEWEFDKAFGWSEDHIKEFLDEYIIKVFKEAKPKKNAVKIIHKLRDEGHKIIVITARSEEHVKGVYNHCAEWLDKYHIVYDKIVVDSHDKAKKCKENDVDIFIDDNIDHCENVFNTMRNTNIYF